MSGIQGQAASVYSTPDTGPGTIVAAVDPTVNDDQYTIGTFWLNTAVSPERVFILVDNTPGAADWDQINAPSGTGVTYGEEYAYLNIIDKVIGPLVNTPVPVGGLSLFPEGGPNQFYGVDYTVRQVIGGGSPGYYICVSTTSTAPGGGAFVGGANPTTGIDSILVSGDLIRVIYPA